MDGAALTAPRSFLVPVLRVCYRLQSLHVHGVCRAAGRRWLRQAGRGPELHELATYIFGDAAYSVRHIRECVKDGKEIPEPMGRKAHFPRDAESVLFRFIAKLRSSTSSTIEPPTWAASCAQGAWFATVCAAVKLPVYKSTVIDYATRLLTGTQFAMYFAHVHDDGEQIAYEWDLVCARLVAAARACWRHADDYLLIPRM